MRVRTRFHRRSSRSRWAFLAVTALVVVPACASGSRPDAAPTAASHAPTTPVSTTKTNAAPDAPNGASSGGRLAAPPAAGVQRVRIRRAPLTTRDWAGYDYSTGKGTVTASAPDDLADSNVREVFWRADAVPMVDQQSCITWDQTAASVHGEPIQPGLAMRIASVGPHNEGLKAVTLTENVVFAGTWLFNVHVWDTTRPDPMTLLHTFDVSTVVGRITNVDGHAANLMVEPPWHLCGRTIGDRFSFKVWTGDDPEPAWSDPTRVYSVALPPGWDIPGYAGGYIGHLHPGQSATATAELAVPITP